MGVGAPSCCSSRRPERGVCPGMPTCVGCCPPVARQGQWGLLAHQLPQASSPGEQSKAGCWPTCPPACSLIYLHALICGSAKPGSWAALVLLCPMERGEKLEVRGAIPSPQCAAGPEREGRWLDLDVLTLWHHARLIQWEQLHVVQMRVAPLPCLPGPMACRGWGQLSGFQVVRQPSAAIPTQALYPVLWHLPFHPKARAVLISLFHIITSAC